LYAKARVALFMSGKLGFLFLVLSLFASASGAANPSDFNGDGVVNFMDFTKLMEAWGQTCEVRTIVVEPQEDKTGIVKNPAMGWVMYVDAFGSFPDGSQYWDRQAKYARFASILYIRAPWSQFEPRQGQYAWENDGNYKDLIEGATNRGLRLAFRVYIDSRDSYRQATPEYVRDAGARGYDSDGWTPYLDDDVFQQKFEDFIEAFGDEYDDPSRVDFIDGNGMGWWGEGHHLGFQNSGNLNSVFDWLCRTYARNFQHVLLGVQYQQHSWGWSNLDNVAIGRYDYVMRRDSLACEEWFQQWEKDRIRDRFPEVPFYAENCYHSLGSSESWWRGDGYDSLRELFRAVMDDALYCHANTLDLRIPSDTEKWMNNAMDMVQEFIEKGGYRLVPTRITYPSRMRRGQSITISHRWKNTAVGVLPNHNQRWNYKYKVAFALLDPADQKVAALVTDDTAEPSQWIQGGEYSYQFSTSFASAGAGAYKLCLAIVDGTKADSPGINLAVSGEKTANGWLVLGDIAVTN